MNSIIKKSIFGVLLTLISATTHGQSLFEDSKGETSLVLREGATASINTSEESLKISYYKRRSDNKEMFGFDISGKSNNGVASLFGNGEFSTDVLLNLRFGINNLLTTIDDLNRFDLINFKFSIGTSEYSMMNSDTLFEQQIKKESFNEVKLGIAYNYVINGNLIFGTYFGYDKTNNLSSLSKLNIKESSLIGVDSTNTTSRSSEKEYTVWQGELNAVDQFAFYLDLAYMPDAFDNRIIFSAYSRTGKSKSQNITNGGLGIYLKPQKKAGEINDPLKVVGGIVYEINDLFDAKESNTNLGSRGTIGLVVGYNF